MGLHIFIPVLEQARLRDRQAENVRRLFDASSGFFQDAGMDFPTPATVNEQCAVIESGHQPNFLPYPGIFKKAYFLQSLVTAARERNMPAIGFFGFADQNLSTAPLLFSNRVPSMTRDGFEKIRFRIPDANRWNQFCRVEKPPRDIWNAKMGRLKDFYIRSIQGVHAGRNEASGRTDQIFDLFDEYYERAKNFADLNAFIFTAICRRFLGLDRIFFFRYSDVQKGRIFIDEAQRVVINRREYIHAHNRALMNSQFTDITTLSPDHVPFWYHCECGRKLELTEISPETWRASCEACGKEYTFDMGSHAEGIEPIYGRLGFTAISRNLVFSEGLGVSVFISGTGGSLRYGHVSGEIAREIGFKVPCTFTWGGKDYYIGPQQGKAIHTLKQVFSLKDSDLVDNGLEARITSRLNGFADELGTLQQDREDRETRKKLAGKLTQARTQVGIITRLLSIHPSVLDLLVSVEPDDLLSVWQNTVNEGNITEDGNVLRLQEDCIYPAPREIPASAIPGIRKSLIQVEACK